MEQRDSETEDSGILEGGGSGGGAEAVREEQPDTRGGPKWALIASILAATLALLTPVFWIIGYIVGPSTQVWMWAGLLTLVVACVFFVLYAFLRKSV